jgi:transcriptional regulator with GAF, ATPase, and Fis domain
MREVAIMVKRIINFLFPDDLIHEPGYIGRIPYLLILRWSIFFGAAVRFWIHRHEYSLNDWYIVEALLFSLFLVALAASIISFYKNYRSSFYVNDMLISIDVILISACYMLTLQPQSDFYLFYYFPILVATEYLGVRGIITVSIFITVSFLTVILWFSSVVSKPVLTFKEILLRVFFIREFFFLFVTVIVCYLRILDRRQIVSMLGFKLELDKLFEEKSILELTLKKGIDIVRADSGFIAIFYKQNWILKSIECYRDNWLPNEDIEQLRISIQFIDEDYGNNFIKDDLWPTTIKNQFPSFLYFPIRPQNASVVGIIWLGSKVTNYYDNYDIERKNILRTLAVHAASAIDRTLLLNSLAVIADTTPNAISLYETLNSILDYIIDNLGFDYAIISLVDEYRNEIESIYARNVPEGWIKRSRYKLYDKDILPDVVRKKETELLDKWDDRLDKDIYDRFGHENYSRIIAPIMNNGNVLGTIEAGCSKGKKSNFYREIKEIERIGEENSDIIKRFSPHKLLEIIVLYVVEILGADSATIHVYKDQEILLSAGAGKATKEFLQKHRPRKGGLAEKAITENRVIIIDQPDILESEHKDLFDEGVRAILVRGLNFGEKGYGVLYIHYWREHKFSQIEKMLEDVLAPQIEINIRNHLLLKRVADIGVQALLVSGWQNLIQSFSSTLNLYQLMGDLVQNILYIMDADNIIYYPFVEQDNYFELPIKKGSFNEPNLIVSKIDPNSILWTIIGKGEHQFIEDVSTEPVFAFSQGDSKTPRFIEREKIKSSCVLVLKAGSPQEIYGIIFINFRERKVFSQEITKNINIISNTFAISIRTARIHNKITQDIEKRAEEVESSRIDRMVQVYKIGRTLLEQNNIDKLTYIFLTGLTHGKAIGFNRAIFFEYDYITKELIGRMAIGPFDKTEGDKIKIEMEKAGDELSIELCIKRFEDGTAFQNAHLNNFISGIKIDIDKNDPFLEIVNVGDCLYEYNTIAELSTSDDLLNNLVLLNFDKVVVLGLGNSKKNYNFVFCDNIYDQKSFDSHTQNLLKILIEHMTKSLERLLSDEKIIEAKKEAWKESSAMAAHVLGNILPFTENKIDEALTNCSGSVWLIDLLEKCKKDIAMCINLSENFKRFAFYEKMENKKSHNINSLLKEIIIDYEEYTEDIKIYFDSLKGMATFVEVDYNAFKIVFLNLLNNTRELKLKSDIVKIAIDRVSNIETYQLGLIKDVFVRIIYEDRGPGIQDKDKENIFEPYYSTKSGNSGLGLVMCRRIIEQHGGIIIENGKYGHGAKFEIILPTAKSKGDVRYEES